MSTRVKFQFNVMRLPSICACHKRSCLWHHIPATNTNATIPYAVLYKCETTTYLGRHFGFIYPTTGHEDDLFMLGAIQRTADDVGKALSTVTVYREMSVCELSTTWIDHIRATAELIWNRCVIMLAKISYLTGRSWDTTEIFRKIYDKSVDIRAYARTLETCSKKLFGEIDKIYAMHDVFKCENHVKCEKGWLVPLDWKDTDAIIITCHLCKQLKFCSRQCYYEMWQKRHRHECSGRVAIKVDAMDTFSYSNIYSVD